MIGKTNVGGGGAGANNRNALVSVYCEAGSTVTMTKGTMTLTPTMWTRASSNTRACALFFVPPRMFDSVNAWTVSMTVGASAPVSATVVVGENKEYTLALYSTLYLIRNGVVHADYEAAFAGYSGSVWDTEHDGYISFTANNQSGTYSTCYFSPDILVTDFKYIVFTGQARGAYNNGNCPAFGIFDTITDSGSTPSTFVASGMLTSTGTGVYTALATTYIDITSVTGEKSVGFQMAGSSMYGYNGGINVYDFYLTNDAPST